MNNIELVLDEIREKYPGIFHKRALQEESTKTVPISDIEIPSEKEIWEERDSDHGHSDYQEKQTNNIPNIWNDLEPERESFEDNVETRKQRDYYGDKPRQIGMEILAVYKPFHFYPQSEWGVLFFERNMMDFYNRQLPIFQSLGFSISAAKKMIIYSVARHEFMHYLHELKTLDLEMTKGGQIYIPYFNNVYSRTYPGPNCIEETIATTWQWDNNVMRTPADLQGYWRKLISTIPANAYSNAANFDHETIRPIEDKLVAQANQCNLSPILIPPVWGSLPRPYVQPWTRYENVQWMMTQSAGGVLASQFHGKVLRKTMQIYHV